MVSYYKKCPYCGRAMEKGSIPPGRYSLKWKSDYENRSSLNYMFNFDKKDVKLSSVWGEICCIAYLCRVCRKIIIDVQIVDIFSKQRCKKYQKYAEV